MGLGAALARLSPIGTVKELLKARYKTTEVVQPMTADGWIRVSSLATLCPREEAICALKSIVRTKEFNGDSAMTFAHGKALHHQLQNDLLPSIGCLLGVWKCTDCGTVYGSKTAMIRRPETCEKCDSAQQDEPQGGPWEKKTHEFKYIEQWFGDEYLRLGGHPDGFVVLPGMPGDGVFEGKSISSRGAANIKSVPDMGHVVQVQAYMFLTGRKWGKIVYWDKGAYGLQAVHEHLVERDEDTIEQIKKVVISIRQSLTTGKLPRRICSSVDCKRAEECGSAKLCFELAEDTTLEGGTGDVSQLPEAKTEEIDF
jgi:hypothetical protein